MTNIRHSSSEQLPFGPEIDIE